MKIFKKLINQKENFTKEQINDKVVKEFLLLYGQSVTALNELQETTINSNPHMNKPTRVIMKEFYESNLFTNEDEFLFDTVKEMLLNLTNDYKQAVISIYKDIVEKNPSIKTKKGLIANIVGVKGENSFNGFAFKPSIDFVLFKLF